MVAKNITGLFIFVYLTANFSLGFPQEKRPTSVQQELRKITYESVVLKGRFIKLEENLYKIAKSFNISWDFDILIGSKDEILIDTVKKEIAGNLYAELPFYGRVTGVKDLYIGQDKIEFSADIGQYTITLSDIDIDINFTKNRLKFVITHDKFSVVSQEPMRFSLSRIPKIGTVFINITSGICGYSLDMKAGSLTLNGNGFIGIDKPKMKFYFDDKLFVTTKSIWGKGKVETIGLNMEEARFILYRAGKIFAKCKKGDIAGGYLAVKF